MSNINNKYSGQYESKNKMDGTFDSYWSLYGYDIDKKSPEIKSVIRAIFNILNDMTYYIIGVLDFCKDKKRILIIKKRDVCLSANVSLISG